MNKKYKARIDRVLNYIEINLANNISLNDVAAISHFSPYHFHRIFTASVGETVNDYISRRRLEKAINQLVCYSDRPITHIALSFGFSSSANFSKAVKLYFGFSPSEIRHPDKIKNSKIGKITSKYGKAFNPNDLYPDRLINNVKENGNLKENHMEVIVKNFDRQRVCTLASKQGYEIESVYQTWDKLINWAMANGIDNEDQQRFALAYDNPTITPLDKCRYLASIVINDQLQIKHPFVESNIPEGKYAVLYFKGQPEDILKAQLSIYYDWLPNSGFEPADYPLVERYLNDARIDGYLEVEICVKLQSL